jgi:hypothetical protein
VLVAAYAPVGGGICFLFVLALLAVGLFGWVAHWSRRGFRASAPRSRAGRIARWAIAALAVALSAAFPPMRRAADWRDETTGEPIPARSALEFDRSLFGYIPSYGWVGSVDREQPYEPGCVMTIDGRGPYRCRSYRWVVDWLFLTGQLVVLGVLLLPFLRANRG